MVSNGTPGNVSRVFVTPSRRDHFAKQGLVSKVMIGGERGERRKGGNCTEIGKHPSCNTAFLRFPVTFTIKTIRDIAASHNDDEKN